MPPGKSRGKVSSLCLMVGICSGGNGSRGEALPLELQQMQLVGERIARGSAEVLLEEVSGGLVQLLHLTGLLAAFVLKLMLEEDEKVRGYNQRYCCIVAERALGNANSERKR